MARITRCWLRVRCDRDWPFRLSSSFSLIPESADSALNSLFFPLISTAWVEGLPLVSDSRTGFWFRHAKCPLSER